MNRLSHPVAINLPANSDTLLFQFRFSRRNPGKIKRLQTVTVFSSSALLRSSLHIACLPDDRELINIKNILKTGLSHPVKIRPEDFYTEFHTSARVRCCR